MYWSGFEINILIGVERFCEGFSQSQKMRKNKVPTDAAAAPSELQALIGGSCTQDEPATIARPQGIVTDEVRQAALSWHHHAAAVGTCLFGRDATTKSGLGM